MLRKTSLILIAAALAWALIGAQAASAAEPNICVAAGGEQRVQLGSTNCDANGTGSVAIARAADSEAYARGGDHNRATASGVDSYAEAGSYYAVGFGDNNTATASGDGSTAVAGSGDNNTATASGEGSRAEAVIGDNNTATATADCTATASGGNDTASCP